VSNINAGTGAENIIPATAEIQFNLRFCTELDEATIKQRTHALLDNYGFNYELQWRLSGQPFLTAAGELIEATHAAIQAVTGFTTQDDTGGGTSDGRFVAPTGAQVIELGLLNETIHKVNEHVSIDDLAILTNIYEQILVNLLVKPTA
jgi:succinyl-diaminopimelate desuccinylase